MPTIIKQLKEHDTLTEFYPKTHWDAVVGKPSITTANWGSINGTLSDQTDLQSALDAKLGKVTTSSKLLYGVAADGTQKMYTAGTGIEFTDAGVINNTLTSAEWGNITGTLSDLTDLETELEKMTISETVQTVLDVDLNVLAVFPLVNNTSSSSTSFTINPNKMYMFGEKSTLTITLAPPTDDTIVNEYMFLFTSGSTATTLNVPNTIKWIKNPDIQTNKKYLVSIENNLGIIGEWSNE